MFVDEVNVILKAGNGGHGCLSFHREKFVPMGGPNGGDGGDGGNLIIECTPHVSDLREFRYKPHAKAENGQPGMGSDCHGRNGEDCILKLPPGTVVVDEFSEKVVTELLEIGQRVVLLKGGRGGFGNARFKSSTNQAPRKITKGKPGEEGRFKFIIKTIAHVGLVGFPNAGKSSLITALTNAQPKIANYPFTTLNPHVGVMSYDHKHIFIADIPGIIEGASENKGLGYKFLRHIERCQSLIFLLDMAGSDGRDPSKDYEVLLLELHNYGKSLPDKPKILVANKSDLPDFSKNLKKFQKKFPNQQIFQISCESKNGLDELKIYLTNELT